MHSILSKITTIYQLLKTVFLFLTLTSLSYMSVIETIQAAPLRVHFIDIGQGDSALIQSPNDKVILIDSGPSKSWKALRDYLDQMNIKTIDLMINTHPHSDHIGNADRILERYHVKMVLDSGFAHPIRAYSNLLESIKKKNVPLKLGRKGRNISIGGGASLELLAPEEPFISGSRSDPNSNSIVFRLTYKDQAALFTGDAEEETEARLLVTPKKLRADLLKVAHHGSKHASGRAFLNAVNPKYAVVSCSETNRYGHPAPETLAGLKRVKAQAMVTAQAGTIVASTEGQSWKFSSRKLSSKTVQINELPKKVSKTNAIATDALPKVSASAMSAKVNVNTASLAELKTLPRIGPALGKRIIESRKTEKFTEASDLRKVRGIGAKTVEKLAPLITF